VAPPAIVTFLFTDIEGSTQALRALGRDEYRERLRKHASIVSEAIERHGGRVVDSSGDAFFAVFPFASAAVHAAVTAQRALVADPSMPRVRMGIHTGEASAEDGTYIGVAVHRAARVAAAAHGGQVLLSNATAGVVADELPEDVALRDLGVHPLKDITHPARLFQLEIAGLPASFPLPRALATPALEGRQRRSPSTRVLALAAAVALVAAVAIVVLLLPRGDHARPSLRLGPNTVGVIDPAKASVVAAIPVGTRPTRVVVAASGVWTLNEGDGTASWIDPAKRRVRRAFAVGPRAGGLAGAEDGVWTTVERASHLAVAKLDPRYAAVTKNADVAVVAPVQPWLSATHAAVWVTYVDELIRYDVRSGDVSRVDAPEGRSLAEVAADDHGAWVLTPSEEGGTEEGRIVELLRFNASTHAFETNVTTIGVGVAAVTAARGRAWVARERGVLEVSPDGSIVKSIRANITSPSAIAVDDDGIVWVADSGSDRVLRFDPQTNAVLTIHLGERPDSIAAGADHVWVTAY
jgi:YVTN family beta-propeller protein